MQRTMRPEIYDIGGDFNFFLGNVNLRRITPGLNNHHTETVDYVWGCALMARRNVFEKIGSLNPYYIAYFEDAELCFRAQQVGYEIVVALKANVVHAIGKSGEKRYLWQTALRLRNHIVFFFRNGHIYHWPTLVPALLLWQLPFMFAQTARQYLARTLFSRKYSSRPITLFNAESTISPMTEEQITESLYETGYFSG